MHWNWRLSVELELALGLGSIPYKSKSTVYNALYTTLLEYHVSHGASQIVHGLLDLKRDQYGYATPHVFYAEWIR